MSAIKKVVVLSNKQTSKSAMALLTVYKNNAGVFATLKNHSMHIKDAILGISVDNKQVLKQHISFDNRSSHSFKLDNNFNLDGKIGCVLVENRQGKITPLVWGMSSGQDSYKQVVMDSLEGLVNKMMEINEQAKKPEVVLKKIEEYNEAENSNEASRIVKEKDDELVLDKDLTNNKNNTYLHKNSGYNEQIGSKQAQSSENLERVPNDKDDINKTINNKDKQESKEIFTNPRTGFHDIANFLNIDNNDIMMASVDSSSSMQEIEEKTIKVDGVSEKEAKLFEYTDEEIEKEIDDTLGFYYLIKDQVDELFSKYPRELDLEKLIPESKWVKVDYENDGHHYVIGLIYQDEELKYICYGVPGTRDKEPPSDFAKYSQWLPTEPSLPEGEGYWLMYQDASDGHSVNLEVI